MAVIVLVVVRLVVPAVVGHPRPVKSLGLPWAIRAAQQGASLPRATPRSETTPTRVGKRGVCEKVLRSSVPAGRLALLFVPTVATEKAFELTTPKA